MLDLFVGIDLATRGTRALAGSALPDAPVVPERTRRHPVRVRLAASLHRIATALEPADAPDRRLRMTAHTAHQ